MVRRKVLASACAAATAVCALAALVLLPRDEEVDGRLVTLAGWDLASYTQPDANGPIGYNTAAGSNRTLDGNCTDPRLEVDWTSIRTYSGVEHCGNLYLQPDLSAPPVVRFPHASTSILYTFLMLDEVGVLNGSWPLTYEPFPGNCCGVQGNPAPIRHWLVGNIPGASLKEGVVPGDGSTCASSASPLCAGSVVTPYLQPGTAGLPSGSHPYLHFIFEQPDKEPIAFPAFDDEVVTNRFHWNYSAFLHAYGLWPKKASNWMVIYHYPQAD